jgi:3'-phosphoadenosine 5'-phosphosulfate sulfotransferase (PAPS reductase)/FAD synthetase
MIDSTKSFPNVFAETNYIISEYRKNYDSCIVSYSGGKDSLCVLDLVSKAGFVKVVCMSMHFLPNLKVLEKQNNYAKERYKVDFYSYQDPSLINWLWYAEYNDFTEKIDKLSSYYDTPIVSACRKESGLELIASGHKRTDAMGQGLANAKKANKLKNSMQPIINWNKFHVLSYMKANNIPVPENDGRNSSSMDLHPKNIIWLYKNHPEDYETVRKVFPYVEAIIKRKEYYNIPEDSK